MYADSMTLGYALFANSTRRAGAQDAVASRVAPRLADYAALIRPTALPKQRMSVAPDPTPIGLHIPANICEMDLEGVLELKV